MYELFPNIPEAARKNAEFMFDMALRQKNLLSTIKVLNEYTNTCASDEEKEFVEFYFNMRMEQMLNER
jgi:hypothetical protein